MPEHILTVRKLDARFRLLDRDGDGYVRREDFRAVVDAVADALGHSADAPERRHAHEVFLGMFDRLARRAETARPGMVARAEYLRVMTTAVASPGWFDRVMRQACEAVFALADRDHDSAITREEFTLTFTASGVPTAQAERAFTALAGPGQGHISQIEYLDAYRDFYTGHDPAAAATLLYGDITDPGSRRLTPAT